MRDRWSHDGTRGGTRPRASLVRVAGMMMCAASLLGGCASRGVDPSDLAFVERQRDQAIAQCNEIGDPARREACLRQQMASTERIFESFEAIHTSPRKRGEPKWSRQRAEIAIEVGNAFGMYELVMSASDDPSRRAAGEQFDMQVLMDAHTLKLKADILLANARWVDRYNERTQKEFYENVGTSIDELRQLRGELHEQLWIGTRAPSAS